MGKTSLPRLVIFGDPKKGDVAEVITEFTDFVRSKAEVVASYCMDDCKVETLQKCDFAVVFGGDGSIISAARNLSQMAVPVIGVNLGKLGYLAEFNLEELRELFDEIITGKTLIEKRMMLGCSVSNDVGEKYLSAAVNDIFITAGPPFGMIELQISVDGQRLAGCISDGLIVCTPTGSTAYNLSVGGPILSSDLKCMVVSPISPHTLSMRSLVLSSSDIVDIYRSNPETILAIDGQVEYSLNKVNKIQVVRARHSAVFLRFDDSDFYATIRNKLHWSGKTINKK